MEELLPLLDSREEAEVTRGLYAVASMSSNTVSAQTAFFEAGEVSAQPREVRRKETEGERERRTKGRRDGKEERKELLR